jgi:hypothetical protein
VERLRKVTTGAYRLSVAANDDDGNPVTVTDPALSIKDGAGAAVTYDGTPVPSAGTITADVPADLLTALDVYSLTWTGTTAAGQMAWPAALEVAGGYLFEVAELRASDASLSDVAKYSSAAVRAARTAAEQRFEAVANLAYVPRGARVVLIGNGQQRIRVPHNAVRRVISATVAGAALTASDLAALTPREWGAIDRPAGFLWDDGAVIELYYEHGLDYPPEPVRQAVMLLAKDYLVRKTLGSRATAESTDIGTFRLSIADKTGSTGIPEVDAVAAPGAFGRRPPLIG